MQHFYSNFFLIILFFYLIYSVNDSGEEWLCAAWRVSVLISASPATCPKLTEYKPYNDNKDASVLFYVVVSVGKTLNPKLLRICKSVCEKVNVVCGVKVLRVELSFFKGP